MKEDISIYRALPSPESIEEVVDLYIEAFRQKAVYLEFLTQEIESIRAILRRTIHPEYGIYALRSGQVIGFAGLDDGKHGIFMVPEWKPYVEVFGLFGGTWRYGTQKFFGGYKRHNSSTLRIDCLAVAGVARGRGVGTQLLKSVFSYAEELGRSAVSLEVVDTNPKARALYERLEFRLTREKHFGAVTRAAGFEALHFMLKEL